MKQFYKDNEIDNRRSYLARLCTEELAVNVVDHGLINPKQRLQIRVSILPSKEIVIYLQDDGRPFDLRKRWELIEQSEKDPAANMGIRIVFGLAEDVQYNSTYGLNNTIIRL